uniref:Uncharacterized protein n=1 Tax=Lepeophtheirus salmonis TaxID=72036 RepID=A0A0K2UTX7_LEPSM
MLIPFMSCFELSPALSALIRPRICCLHGHT